MKTILGVHLCFCVISQIGLVSFRTEFLEMSLFFKHITLKSSGERSKFFRWV